MANTTTSTGRSASETDGINPQYDDPNTYGIRNSFYGNGKYPPDWGARREVVWSRQRYQCARCGIYKGDASGVAVHHVVHLANGGGNQLDNLAGLCRDCHALMHPNVEYVDGTPSRAAVFPDRNARDDVAVIRWPEDAEELETDLEHLAATSEPDRNAPAVTEAAVPCSAGDAKRATAALSNLLIERGYVPRRSAYHSVTVEPVYPGLLGLVTRYEPPMSVKHDASATEADDWTGLRNRRRRLLFTEDAREVTVRVEDSTGDPVDSTVTFDEPGTESDCAPVLSPPPLNAQTAPKYALDATIFTVSTVGARGIVPALLVALFAPGLLPFGRSLLGFLFVVVWFGALLTLPMVYEALRQ